MQKVVIMPNLVKSSPAPSRILTSERPEEGTL